MIPTLTSDMFARLAPRFGLFVWIEPKWRVIGYLETKRGERFYWNGSAIDLNLNGASEISRDKAYTNEILRAVGFKVPMGRAFGSKDWCAAIGSGDGLEAALAFASDIGYPVVAKPNASQGGEMVYKTKDGEELEIALQSVFSENKLALVEKEISGTDARILVLDGEVLLAYERSPLSVTGDGESGIGRLIEKREEFLKGRGRVINLENERARIFFHISKNFGYYLDSVPKTGETVVLLPSSNLSTGGDIFPIALSELHDGYKQLAKRAMETLNLRYGAIDLISASSWDRPPDDTTYILEINGKQPGLAHYRLARGEEGDREVEEIYLKILEALVADV